MNVVQLNPPSIYDELRNNLQELPFMVRELLIGNVVVGNFTNYVAQRIGHALIQKFQQQEKVTDIFRFITEMGIIEKFENTDGDGI